VPLDGERGILEKGEILDVGRILQIDQDTEPLSRLRAEGRLEKTLQAEGGKVREAMRWAMGVAIRSGFVGRKRLSQYGGMVNPCG